jgi:hypothetical protein
MYWIIGYKRVWEGTMWETGDKVKVDGHGEG